MNPSSGTNSSQCTGYSDYTVGNSNSGDGNTTGLEYSTNVTLNETYSLEVEGGFCGNIPSLSTTPNRSFKVYIDYNSNDTFEDDKISTYIRILPSKQSYFKYNFNNNP